MTRKGGRRARDVEKSYAGPMHPGWAALRMLNRRCLDVLASLAQNYEATHIDILRLHADLWGRLDEPARECAARCPVALVDMQFDQDGWWRQAADLRTKIPRKASASQAIPAKYAGELIREVLAVGHDAAAMHPGVPALILGGTRKVASIISMLSQPEIERLAKRFSHFLSPRWSDDTVFWRLLLTDALEGDEELQATRRSASIQMTAGRFLPMNWREWLPAYCST